MLVLTRKVGQRIEIENGISVVIQRIQGKRVVLGIEAPRNIAIHRDELPSADGRRASSDTAAARAAGSASTIGRRPV